MKQAVMLVIFLVAVFAAAAIGAQFTPGPWFETLAKPAWNPPNWVFAPVWTVLYSTIGVSGWLVWKKAGFSAARLPFFVYGIQLVLNAAWSWLFFGLHRPDLAFLEIVVLWAAILATIVLFWRIRVAAGAILLPYLAWVSFAAILNWTLRQMNP
jgi:benzodiazapine receptor